jgi:hypothetical protein
MFTSKNDIRKAVIKGIYMNIIREMIEGNKNTQAVTCGLYQIVFIFLGEYFTIISKMGGAGCCIGRIQYSNLKYKLHYLFFKTLLIPSSIFAAASLGEISK